MSKHITEWLNAYLDSELRDGQVQQVEAHLVECETCRAELESLARVSSMLHEVPVPEFTLPERFAAQVNLRLPRQRIVVPRNRLVEVGWWLVPVGLLVAWIFVSTSFFVNDLLSAANNLGLLANAANWLVFDTESQMYWSATLGQVGFLRGSGLDWAISTEGFTRISLLQISLQISIGLLYLSWLAVWLARRWRQGQGRLLEG